MSSRYYIGLMSGTSMDGIDALVADFRGTLPSIVSHLHRDYPTTLRDRLQALIGAQSIAFTELGELDIELGRFAAQTVEMLLEQSGLNGTQISAVGSHGQTLFHAPEGNSPFTLQIGDPNTIAQLSGITTVADLRRADMAVGGQGAPLAPALHVALFQKRDRSRAVLNLGGIANLTLIPSADGAPIIGFDTGPANCLMDEWIGHHHGERFDHEGSWAASGRLDNALLEHLLADPYFNRAAPKSTGREYFHMGWLKKHFNGGEKAEDVQTTLCHLTAYTIADALKASLDDCSELIICGGGAYNRYLLQLLKQRLPGIDVTTSADYGIDPEQIEALAFAWFAQQTLMGETGNLPSVTGASRPVVLGGIYQGHPHSLRR